MMNRHEEFHKEHASHFEEVELIEWKDVRPGEMIVLDALDLDMEKLGIIKLHVLDVRTDEVTNSTKALLFLEDDKYSYVQEDGEPEYRQLHGGTVLLSGASQINLPDESVITSDNEGLRMGQDYVFEAAIEPDGNIVESPLVVPNIRRIRISKSRTELSLPDQSLENYWSQFERP